MWIQIWTFLFIFSISLTSLNRWWKESWVYLARAVIYKWGTLDDCRIVFQVPTGTLSSHRVPEVTLCQSWPPAPPRGKVPALGKGTLSRNIVTSNTIAGGWASALFTNYRYLHTILWSLSRFFFFCLCFLGFFWDPVSLCSPGWLSWNLLYRPGWPWTQIHLLLPPKCWD